MTTRPGRLAGRAENHPERNPPTRRDRADAAGPTSREPARVLRGNKVREAAEWAFSLVRSFRIGFFPD